MHAKAAAGHAKALHLLIDSGAQAAGSLTAQLAEFCSFALVMASVGVEFFLQAFAGLIVGVEAFHFIEQLLL